MPLSWSSSVTAAVAAAALAALAALVLRQRELAANLADAVERRNRLALELMSTRNQRMHTAKGVEIGRSFKPRPTDVFVVTYPKCGTTWMTQICHALRTNGSMDFGDINEVCPWEIMAHDCKQDLSAEHVANPRVWKSHEGWTHVAKGAKYIYVARDPMDAFFSFFKFLPSFTGLRGGDIDEEAFAKAIFAGASHSGQIWDHFLGWYEQLANENVLWVFFEDLASDLRTEVKRVARFMGIEADDALLDAAVKCSSFEAMSAKENRHHYDDHYMKAFIYPEMGIDPKSTQEVIKVRAGGGKVGGSRRGMSAELRARLEAKWAAVLAGPTGCATYADFAARVRRERRY